jgi:hypothetical protein
LSQQKNAGVLMVTGLDLIGIPAILEWMTAGASSGHSSNQGNATSQADISNGSAPRGLMNYRCKMCGYDQMPFPPNRHNICPCCGIEYGVDDALESYERLRD